MTPSVPLPSGLRQSQLYYYHATSQPVRAAVWPSVAVIIIGYNAACFLAPCLDSVLNQTHRPDEVVFVDDASTDHSVELARQFEGVGLRVLRRPENGGMCEARMTGVEATQSTLLLFVDSDNVLPPNYLATMLEDLRDHAFVYPAKQFFGHGPAMQRRMQFHPSGVWLPPEADRARLWQDNYADTCSLLRRSVLLAAGGWRNNAADTCQDWSLMLRMSRLGSHARSRAVLHYRVHADNWSEREACQDRLKMRAAVRQDAVTLSIATIYSGRMPGLWHEWLRCVKATLHAAGRQAELIILDASPEGALDVDRTTGPFTAVQVRRAALPAEAVKRRMDRRATAEFLAAAFNDVLAVATGDVVWTIEDDTIVPVHACQDLLAELLGGRDVRTAVGGLYHSRHQPLDYVAANLGPDGRPVHWQQAPAAPRPVTFTGTGCLMLLKDRLRGLRWTAEWNAGGLRSSAHDWTLAWALHERGDPIVMVPSVLCRHHQTEEVWV
jgi:glycosyltransferase involved in cell wall biosynthesis